MNEEPREVLVCDRWPLKLTGGKGGYYEYVNDRAGEVGRNAHCIYWLLEQLQPQARTVSEPFGGVGVFATVIQGFCQPEEHRIYDIDADCLRQLEQAFAGRPGVSVQKGNAWDTIGEPADFHMLDFPFFTALHFDEWRPQLNRLFATKPELVIWMDGASFGMHWHAQRYAKLLEWPVRDNFSYACAISERVQREYGYAVQAATVSRGCFYFAFAPGESRQFELREFNTQGRALRSARDRVLLK